MRKLLILCVAILLTSCVGCSPNRPEISEEVLKNSAQIIEGYDEIEEAEVVIKDSKIKFYLVPYGEDEVSKERVRELGEDFLKVLSGFTVTEELQGPSDESYGEIYDYYDVEIIVEGYRVVIDKGIKDKSDTEIQWQK